MLSSRQVAQPKPSYPALCRQDTTSQRSVHTPLSVHSVVVSRCSQSLLRRQYSPPKEIAVQSRVDKHARNIQNRSSTRVLALAHKSRKRVCGARPSSSLNVDVSGCFLQRRSRIPHQCNNLTNRIHWRQTRRLGRSVW